MGKRFCAFFLVLLCLIPVLSISVFSADKGVLSLSADSVMTDGTLKVRLSLDDNPGLATLRIELKFNEAEIELSSVSSTDLLAVTPPLNSKYQSPYTISWINSSTKENLVNNGVLAVFSFRVRENVRAESTKISVVCKDSYSVAVAPVSFLGSEISVPLVQRNNGENPISSSTPSFSNVPSLTTSSLTSVSTTLVSVTKSEPVSQNNVSSEREEMASTASATVTGIILNSDHSLDQSAISEKGFFETDQSDKGNSLSVWLLAAALLSCVCAFWLRKRNL